MIGNKDLFLKIDTNITSQFEFDNNNSASIHGREIVSFKSKASKLLYMHSSLFIPSLKDNFLSISQLSIRGYITNFKRKQCTIVKDVNNHL